MKDEANVHASTPTAPDASSLALNRKKSKKKAYILIAVLCGIGIVSAVVLQNPQWFERKVEEKNTSMYSDRVVSYSFYPTDYDLDVTADETYMELDRYVYYTNGAETIAIVDGDYEKYGPAIAFFGEYFATVIAGDTETYNTYFTEHYYESNAPHTRFAPQMLYNIRVEKLWEELEDNTITPLKPGKTDLLLQSETSAKTIEINVKEAIKVTKKPSETTTILEGKKNIDLNNEFEIENTFANETLVYESSNPDIISVDENGTLTNSYLPGKCTITVYLKTEKGNLKIATLNYENRLSKKTIILVIVLVVVLIFLLILFIVIFSKMKKRKRRQMMKKASKAIKSSTMKTKKGNKKK